MNTKNTKLTTITKTNTYVFFLVIFVALVAFVMGRGPFQRD